MTEPEAATALSTAAEAILRALARAGIGDNVALCMGALGVVVGSLALASGVPDEALAKMTDAAKGVINGSLMQ